jgi:hypothetical protein
MIISFLLAIIACLSLVCGESICDITDCDDMNVCTIDTCDESIPIASGGPCVHAPVVCPPSSHPDLCLVQACVVEIGRCDFQEKDCSDNNVCTEDSCDHDDGSCRHRLIVQCNDDGNKCTDDFCNPVDGNCIHPPINCDDGNACTNEVCNPADGMCIRSEAVCNDNNACTVDSCSPKRGCIFTPIVCDDNNACTVDSCNPQRGCIFTPVVCNDNSACTVDSCNPDSGCTVSPIDCSDGNACTDDTCVDGIGCIHPRINCVDTDACTLNSCNPASGCAVSPIVCSDNDLCTVDSCDSTNGCVFQPIVCNDNNACTDDVCDDGNCIFTPIDCDDACTNVKCDDGDTCTEDTCESIAGCVFVPIATVVKMGDCPVNTYAFAIDNDEDGDIACIDFGGDKRSTPLVCPDRVAITGSGASPFGTALSSVVFTSGECSFTFDDAGHLTAFALSSRGGDVFKLTGACGVFQVDVRKRQVVEVGSGALGTLQLQGIGQGDPHLLTPWGVRFDFIGEASANYVLFSAPQVQVNMKLAAAGPTVRFMTSIAVMFANETFVFHAGMHAFDNLPAVKRAVEARGGRVTLAHGWRLQVYLCDGVEVQVSASHRGSFNFLNVLFVTPGCLLAVGGALGHTYDCKYEVAPQSFEWSHSLEELFRIAELTSTVAPLLDIPHGNH